MIEDTRRYGDYVATCDNHLCLRSLTFHGWGLDMVQQHLAQAGWDVLPGEPEGSFEPESLLCPECAAEVDRTADFFLAGKGA